MLGPTRGWGDTTVTDTAEKDPIHQGGLMRCCLLTYTEIAPPGGMAKEGDTMRCSYCNERMVLRDGVWKWDNAFGEKRGETRP